MLINFDREVERLIAKPSTKDGIPMYVRVDGKVDGINGVERVPENSEYARKSKDTCSSPDNLKRIFITCKGVYVHLHKPVVGSGKGLSLKREYSYSDDIKEVIRVKEMLHQKVGMSYGGQFNGLTLGDIQMVIGTNTYNNMKGSGVRGKLEMVGFGVGALKRLHIYQNVEEIYIDWLPLSNMAKDRGRDFSYYLQVTGGNMEKAMLMLFKDCCGQGTNDILGRFPRLHTIGYIPDLGYRYEQLDKNLNSNFFGCWADKFGLRKVTNSCIVSVRKDKKWIMDWSVKPGTYVFDRDVLLPYSQNVTAQYKDKLAKEEREREESRKCDKEKALDKIYTLSGEKYARATLKAMIVGKEITVSEIKETFTERGVKKYTALLNS